MHNLIFKQLQYTKTLKTTISFGSYGIIIRESVYQIILYKMLNN